MILGAIGILIPILLLAGHDQLLLVGQSPDAIQIGVMISGSILFGSGVIATAILYRK